MEKIRLIIISEDITARRGLNAIFGIERAFDVLACVSLQEALEKVIDLQPDVILVDIPGEEIAKCGQKFSKIKHDCPCSIIISLVENEQCNYLAEFLEKGIDSCIPRGIMRSCLVKTVELTCRAGVFCMPGSFRKMLSCRTGPPGRPNNSVNLGGFGNNTSGIIETLTRRETEILQLMAGNYNNQEIAGKLFISEPTVKTHVSSILRKLGQRNRAQAIVYSYKIGLVSDKQFACK